VFVGIAIEWMIVVKMGSRAVQQSNLF